MKIQVHLWGDLVQQVAIIIAAYFAARSPLDRRPHNTDIFSSDTAHRRGKFLLKFAKTLKREYKHLTLRNIQKEHILYLLDQWKLTCHSVGTVQNYLAFLRAILKFAGINVRDVVPTNAEACVHVGLPATRMPDNLDKSLEGHGVDFWTVYWEAHRHDPRVALVFLRCWLWGLRREESYKWRAPDGVMGSKICVCHGAKNNQYRSFEIEMTVVDMQCIELGKRYANSSTGSLIPDGMTEKQFRNHIKYIAKKCGLTKAQLGVTPYGLRHSFAQRFWEKHAGTSHALRRMAGIPIDPYLNFISRMETTEALGHHSVKPTVVYIGPVDDPFILRRESKREV
ncbi:MAG TPA: phage integrase N-terminal domain-containing protein [Gammaproteobacteria bacterium]|nr:phage integrase N-terminal domain-containing protein [Gammaproteobacteria bacterium]